MGKPVLHSLIFFYMKRNPISHRFTTPATENTPSPAWIAAILNQILFSDAELSDQTKLRKVQLVFSNLGPYSSENLKMRNNFFRPKIKLKLNFENRSSIELFFWISLVLFYFNLFTKYYSEFNAYSIYLPLNIYLTGTPFSSFFAIFP